MDFEVLYSMALDIIHKREGIVNTKDKNVCIIEAGSTIFTSITSYEVIDNVLYTQCAEKKAIQSMIQANITNINQMIIVNCKTLELMLPCQECVDMLVDMVNKYNLTAILHISNNNSVYLKDLKSVLNGGGIVNIPKEYTYTGFENLNIFQPNGQSKEEVNENTTDNSLPLEAIQEQKSVYSNYSVRCVDLNNSTISTEKNSVQSNNIINQREDNSVVYLERLQGIIQGDMGNDTNIEEDTPVPKGIKKIFNVFKSVNMKNTKNTQTVLIEGNSLNTPHKSKKELILMAKERKKQLKKDAKLRDYFEKKEKKRQGK